MKKSLFLTLLFVAVNSQLNAQEADKFRFDFDLGYAIPQGGGGGLAFYLEPKWNIKDNMNLGLRLGVAVMAKEIETVNNNTSGKVGANGSYVGTFDYYFNKKGGSFVPFVGGGAGYYSVVNLSFDGDIEGVGTLEESGKIGGMIRGGFNWGKFKMTLDYNLVGKSDLQDVDGQTVGTSKNGYLGVSLGFFLGGGKWGNYNPASASVHLVPSTVSRLNL